MIIYIVEAMAAQSCESTSWIVKAFDSEEKANIWVDAELDKENAKDTPDTYCYIITEKELE